LKIKSDDVKHNDFEITIEFYSYELLSTANNILQSAKKLAKQLTDFATFKRNPTNTGQLQQSMSSLNNLPAQSNGNNGSNNYSYSMHKFKLIARAKLTASDISEDIETKPLQVINESSLDQTNGNNLSNANLNINSNSTGTLNLAVNSANSTTKLPLFDFYSCCLCKLNFSSLSNLISQRVYFFFISIFENYLFINRLCSDVNIYLKQRDTVAKCN